MIPLFVDCSKKRIVIFGGGVVASRKAMYFSDEADVLVVSRSFLPKITALPVKRRVLDVSTIPDDLIEALIDGAFLVIGTFSDPLLNNRIGNLCRARGILFNNADGEAGDVILPSVTGGKYYTLAISTKGSSPAVSRFIRTQLENHYPALDDMVALQHELREQLKHIEPSQSRRTAILREVLSDHELWETLKKDPALAREKVNKRYLHE
ncbi:MAG: bifunctional precorrin-2 dehydrogenase/sirohydrochlorin ferrochelatase [Methanoregula sp.]|jgi:precorrin-2 dehydrogenase/sirohydrochlorin ferrochelatase|nr:bifunctional precorrin-2 dehydrogenase/sirohydrochlorin ferrochelatase [Methanoregula sp.]